MDRRTAVNEIKREEARNISTSKLLRDAQLVKLSIWTDALKANRKAAKRDAKDIWRWQIYDADALKVRIMSDHWSRESLATLWAARAIMRIAPQMLAKRHKAEWKEWNRAGFLEKVTRENIERHQGIIVNVRVKGTTGEQRFYSIPEVAFRQRVHNRMQG